MPEKPTSEAAPGGEPKTGAVTNTGQDPTKDPAKTPPPAEPTQVRVITKGPLGPKLLEPGTMTSEPEYVALLKVKGQKKVEAVK